MSIKTIALAVAAGTPAAVPTAKYAICLAKIIGARVAGIYVVDERSVTELLRNRVFVEIEAREYEKELKDQGKILLERIGRMAESKSVPFEPFLLSGAIHRMVVDKAAEIGADLLVMGKIRELESRKEIFYDPGEQIFRESPCQVVIVQNSAAAEALFKEI
ncbi:MAG: universal stress protein [Candidatus Omnitrophota bacterium]|jgi:nucleotide-binding universal stress UspA family protein